MGFWLPKPPPLPNPRSWFLHIKPTCFYNLSWSIDPLRNSCYNYSIRYLIFKKCSYQNWPVSALIRLLWFWLLFRYVLWFLFSNCLSLLIVNLFISGWSIRLNLNFLISFNYKYQTENFIRKKAQALKLFYFVFCYSPFISLKNDLAIIYRRLIVLNLNRIKTDS